MTSWNFHRQMTSSSRWGLLTLILTVIFWGMWSLFGSVPEANFGNISRWWDVFFFPSWIGIMVIVITELDLKDGHVGNSLLYGSGLGFVFGFVYLRSSAILSSISEPSALYFPAILCLLIALVFGFLVGSTKFGKEVLLSLSLGVGFGFSLSLGSLFFLPYIVVFFLGAVLSLAVSRLKNTALSLPPAQRFVNWLSAAGAS